MWSNFMHILFAVLLHISGVICALWIWYLFPKNIGQFMLFEIRVFLSLRTKVTLKRKKNM
ncbi:unnamed protein product [Enterobius vermicularis]|uniref:Vesicle transport protein GOT1B n=1 Tax=Enterobius vermicularis TaxID=51028 RepID=A0A0N4VAX6_ENTVE|nr:unnamed protein product [Enterobius vermicularis]